MKKDGLIISIIVPIYNTEKYLKKCIDSLINQTYKNIEIILINDGSKDNSHNIVSSYRDKRIKYYKKENEGIGKTRNFGIDKATGDYLMFIDSDDYISKDCCEKFYNKIKKSKADIVVSDFYKDINGKYEYIKIDDFEDSNLKDNSSLLVKINPGPCNKVYKRELVINNNIRFNEQYKYEDSPFVIESLIKAKKIVKLNEALSYYCIHNNSETTVRDDRVFDIIKIIDIIREKAKDYNYLKNDLDKFTVDLITNYTIQQRYQKNKKVRNSFIDESFKYMKSNIKDYKSKKYYPNKSFFRRQIESHKTLTKLYCNIYVMKKR
jgi:glycosyltransferase involved in cell wall biosynthesis